MSTAVAAAAVAAWSVYIALTSRPFWMMVAGLAVLIVTVDMVFP